jgi:hypothetical protein
MTKEKEQLDNIIELYNSGIEVNIKLAIETATSIFGINVDELEYMARVRGGKLIPCRMKESEIIGDIDGIGKVNFLVSNETTLKIKHNSSLPDFLTRLFKEV